VKAYTKGSSNFVEFGAGDLVTIAKVNQSRMLDEV
jgi:hypothetical protein